MQFRFIALTEFGKAFRPVIEPFAQFGRGGNITIPLIQPGILFGQATRPDPVHQDAVTVFWQTGFIDALDDYIRWQIDRI